jgi:protein-S-isoprenylcysteine O-methyltransferase Ste14
MIAIRSILFFLLVPVILIGALPVWLVQTGTALFSFGVFRWLAIPFWLVGWVSLVWSFASFTIQGRGTPNPLDPPRELVVTGLYRFVRNPIYVGGFIALLGYVLWSPSLPVLIMPLIFIVAAFLFVHFYEEPHLRRTFGKVYEDYCCSVPGWLPRLKRLHPA